MDSLKELQKAWPMTYLRLDWPFFVLSDFQEVKDGVLVLCINLLGASDWCLQSGPALRNKSLTTSEPLCHAARMLAQKWKPSWKRRFSTTTRSETIREIPNKNHNIYIYIYVTEGCFHISKFSRLRKTPKSIIGNSRCSSVLLKVFWYRWS